MAGQDHDSSADEITGINVTPLVDVVLVLLIIFMVTATYIVHETIDVELPRAASGGESVGTTLNIVLDREGKLYLDGAESSFAEARLAVKAAIAEDKDAKAVISADKRVSHGQVVEVIDLVKTEGLTKFAINIEKDTASAAPSETSPTP